MSPPVSHGPTAGTTVGDTTGTIKADAGASPEKPKTALGKASSTTETIGHDFYNDDASSALLDVLLNNPLLPTRWLTYYRQSSLAASSSSSSSPSATARSPVDVITRPVAAFTAMAMALLSKQAPPVISSLPVLVSSSYAQSKARAVSLINWSMHRVHEMHARLTVACRAWPALGLVLLIWAVLACVPVLLWLAFALTTVVVSLGMLVAVDGAVILLAGTVLVSTLTACFLGSIGVTAVWLVVSQRADAFRALSTGIVERAQSIIINGQQVKAKPKSQ